MRPLGLRLVLDCVEDCLLPGTLIVRIGGTHPFVSATQCLRNVPGVGPSVRDSAASAPKAFNAR